MLFVLVLYMSTKQHFILNIVEMRFKQMVKIRKEELKFLFIATATEKPHCFCGSGITTCILMLHFILFEVYNDVVHLHVCCRRNRKASDLSVSGTEIQHKKAFSFPDRRQCENLPLMPCLGGLGQSDSRLLYPAVVSCGKTLSALTCTQ